MKNRSSVRVNSKGQYSEITTTINIPFKKWEEREMRNGVIDYKQVLGTYSEVIVRALRARMEACVNILSKNIFNIVMSDEVQIIYRKENGTLHSFNHPSYRAMGNAIIAINSREFDKLDLGQIDQILKALVWCEEREDINGLSFSNLISCVSEMHMSKR